MGYWIKTWIKTSTYTAHVNAADDLSPETDAALHAVMRAAYRRLRDLVARKHGQGGRRARRRRGIRAMRCQAPM